MNWYASRGVRKLRTMAEVERDRDLQACRQILTGPDGPDRRRLIASLADPHLSTPDPAGLSPLALDRVREQLTAEFHHLLSKE